MLGLVEPAALSPPDGFRRYEFWLVRETPCPADLSGQPFDLEYVAYALSSFSSTGALEWLPRDTQQELHQDTLSWEYVFLENVKVEEQREACPSLESQPTQPVSPQRGPVSKRIENRKKFVFKR